MVVLGVNGVIVDGCPVFPATNPLTGPVTVPLPNNSSIEIYKKRFQFCYPPKELRETLINTPAKGDSTPDRRRRRRTLRMSMIQSAQVFTPRPSHNPRENLRVLKTPIKSPFKGTPSPAKRRESSPMKRGAYIPEDIQEEDEEEEDIVLVESNHPRVVEEDRDLIILEHVVVREPEPEPEPEPEEPQWQHKQYPMSPSPQMVQTPPRPRPNPRSSLHRAVLLRSAHRSAMRREMEMEDEAEAEEVEEIFEKVEQMQDLQAADDEDEEDYERQQQEEEAERDQQTPRAVSGWRKSLDAVRGWAFGGSSAAQRTEDDDQEGNEEEQEQEQGMLETEVSIHESLTRAFINIAW